MECSRPARTRQQGFSLVELSIVIAIVSVVAVLGLESIGLFMNRTAYRVTQERMAVIKDALNKYRFVNGALPCPANFNLAPSNVNYAKEARAGGACNASIMNNQHYGLVPVRDLNLPFTYLKDGYGSTLRYIVTPALARAGAASGQFSNPASVGQIIIRTGKIEQPCTTLCQEIAQAAYVVLSFGADRRGSTPGSCIPSADYDGMIDSVNCRFGVGQVRVNGSGAVAAIPDHVFYDSRYNNGSVEEMHFDDIIIWQTKSQL